MRQLLVFLILLLAGPVWASEEIGRQEDTASATGQVLMPTGCVRQDTVSNLTDTDGDYANIKCNNVGRVYTSSTIDAALPTGSNTIGTVTLGTGSNSVGTVVLGTGANAVGSVTTTSQVPGTGSTNLGKAEDQAHVSADTGVFVLGVRHDISSTGLGIDGDYAALSLNASGELYVVANTEMPAAATLADNTTNPTVPGVAAFLMCFDGATWDRCQPSVTDTDDNSVTFSQTTSMLIGLNYLSDGSSWIRERVYLEDVAASGHDAGQLRIMGTVRQDTPASNTSTDGDYSYLKVDSVGRLWINCGTGCSGGFQPAEDAAHSSGDTGNVALVRRVDDTPTSSSTTNGDYSTLNTDAIGLLWVRPLDPCGGIAKTHIAINISTAATTELTASLAGASNNYYICSIDLVTAAANNVALTDDDSDNCTSVTSGLAGGTTAASGWNFAANGGLVKGNGMGTVYKTNGTNRVVCLVTSAATQLSGSIQVVAAP